MGKFTIDKLTDENNGLFKLIEDELDNLKIVLPYYEDVIQDVGVNNDYELGDLLLQSCHEIIDKIKVLTNRLENIRYGNKPFPPCYSGETGPRGWVECE